MHVTTVNRVRRSVKKLRRWLLLKLNEESFKKES